jgi:hypothetical protein
VAAQRSQAPADLPDLGSALFFARQGRQWFTPSQVVAHSWHTTLRQDMQSAKPCRPGWCAQLWPMGEGISPRERSA